MRNAMRSPPASNTWRAARRGKPPAHKTAGKTCILSGPDFRQFLLSEQARVTAVLERLAAGRRRTAIGARVTITPMTLPGRSLASMFVAGALVFVLRTRRRWTMAAFTPGAAGVHLAGVLLAQPLVFSTAGFVVHRR